MPALALLLFALALALSNVGTDADVTTRTVGHSTKPAVSVSEIITVPEDARFTLSPVVVTSSPAPARRAAPAAAPVPAPVVLVGHVIYEDGSGRDTYSDGSVITFCLEGQLCADGDTETIANTEGWEWDCATMGNRICGPVAEPEPEPLP